MTTNIHQLKVTGLALLLPALLAFSPTAPRHFRSEFITSPQTCSHRFSLWLPCLGKWRRFPSRPEPQLPPPPVSVQPPAPTLGCSPVLLHHGQRHEPLGAKSLAPLFVFCVGPGEIESIHWPVSLSCPHPPILALNKSSFSSRYSLSPLTRRGRSCTQAVCVPPFHFPSHSHAFRAVTPHPCHASVFCLHCPSSPPAHSRSSLAPQGPADVSPACAALPAGSSHL